MSGLRCLPLIGGKQVPVGGYVSRGVHLINCTPGWSRDLIEEGIIGEYQFLHLWLIQCFRLAGSDKNLFSLFELRINFKLFFFQKRMKLEC